MQDHRKHIKETASLLNTAIIGIIKQAQSKQ